MNGEVLSTGVRYIYAVERQVLGLLEDSRRDLLEKFEQCRKTHVRRRIIN